MSHTQSHVLYGTELLRSISLVDLLMFNLGKIKTEWCIDKQMNDVELSIIIDTRY